ncbi:class E sortase [Streptomyces tsukubensis]|nr:class E sortase [Streptomyces tsukubensis]
MPPLARPPHAEAPYAGAPHVQAPHVQAPYAGAPHARPTARPPTGLEATAPLPVVTPGPPAASAVPLAPAPADDETVALRRDDVRRIAGRGRRQGGERGGGTTGAPLGGSLPAGSGASVPPGEGRAARRRAAQRARKPGPAAVISGVVGELFITLGVVMLLFVTYQLWWTNIRAHAQANGATSNLQHDWADGKGKPGVFEPGKGFAIMSIPKLDVVVPIAEGIDKHRVLDRGMVGHYGEGSLRTPMPDAKTGNFAVAGHRNTHGEPFRYINQLKPGDPVVVETRDTYYVYKMTSILPQTPPSNTDVLKPIPTGSGFTKTGRYITLTTCTPEFTSTYRMIVWGKMVEERPRSEGKPRALVPK